MNPFAIIFLLLNAAALMTVPRRWAALPLLLGACYMTLGQGIQIGPFHFPVLRLILLAGVLRVLARRERPAGGFLGLDWLMVVWGAWALLSSAFHKAPGEALVFRLGLVYNCAGVYFLCRIFCQSLEEAIQIIKILALVLAPVALEMTYEHFTGRNLFAFLGGVPAEVIVRNGRLRATGPFSVHILAGTVGAVCLPPMVGIWRSHPRPAKIGAAACLGMVIMSNSSGPLMSTIFSIFALLLWRWRHLTRQMRIAAVVGYILLVLVMKAPAYYLIDRIDLVGGSTGFHRADLINQSINHLNDWWFAGTDYTRDWMPYGVEWSPDQVDITNQYIAYGVLGGLPLMVLFLCVLGTAFSYVGKSLRAAVEGTFAEQFMIWSLGAALFSHAASCVSISYFDQSFLFLYLNLGMIGSLRASQLSAQSALAGTAPGEDQAGQANAAEPVPVAAPWPSSQATRPMVGT